MAISTQTYQHIQSEPSAIWTVVHNLNNYPIVDVMVIENNVLQKIIPKDIVVVNMNTCEIHFSTVRTGQARLV
jgi:hypothetical protein